jgi:hypothetical protein
MTAQLSRSEIFSNSVVLEDLRATATQYENVERVFGVDHLRVDSSVLLSEADPGAPWLQICSTYSETRVDIQPARIGLLPAVRMLEHRIHRPKGLLAMNRATSKGKGFTQAVSEPLSLTLVTMAGARLDACSARFYQQDWPGLNKRR